MPQPGTRPNAQRSKRGRLSEGRQTKKTPEMVARVAEAISLGLTDEETSALIDIEPNALPTWKKDPEYDPNAVVSTGKEVWRRWQIV